MHHLIRPAVALICGIYGLFWVGADGEKVKNLLGGVDFASNKQPNALGLSDDVFDQCKLQNGPLWTEKLKKWLNPFHNPMKKCNHSYVPWSEILSDGRIGLTDEWPEEADCRARAVLLMNEYRTTRGQWYEIREEHIFDNDIVEVECQIDDVPVYNFLHYQVWPNNGRIYSKNSKKSRKNTNPKPPSMYIIVLDSIGASHGRRVYNQTQRFLKEEFGAIEMQHMNKVGENSRPNGIAFLFGKLCSPISRNMYGLPPFPRNWNWSHPCKTYLDDKGFILKEFEKNGYKTLMAEDWDKGVFNWPGCKGFEKQPTTHYMRPFQLRLSQRGKAMKEHMSGAHCYEPHLYLNGYLEKFINAYPDLPKAALTWASYLGHDSPDEPFHSDVHFKDFFERNKKEFDDSFVFFMGDHGLRFGWYSKNPVGRRDVDNPMLMVSVPRRLRKDLLSNLQQNSHKLLTMFDTHATFVDIVNSFSGNEPIDFIEPANITELIGSSLLRPLPEGPRSCKTLPIPPQFCLCEIEKLRVNLTEDHKAIGESIASVVNKRLSENNVTDSCAHLEFDKITQLLRIVGAQDLYDVTVQLRPGGGLFKTFVRGSAGEYSVVVPDVTRLNKYGKQGDCITQNYLRPLCYCNSILNATTPTAANLTTVQ